MTARTATRSAAPPTRRVPVPAPDADGETIFRFGNLPADHRHLLDRGVALFEWAGEWTARFHDAGELPEGRAELLSLLCLLYRAIRFEAFAEDYDIEIEERAPMARAILSKLEALGVDHVAVPA